MTGPAATAFKAPRPWAVTAALVTAPFALAVYAIALVALFRWRAASGQPGGADFVNDWMGAWLTLHGHAATVFDPAAYGRALRALWPGETFNRGFPYPPSFLPVILWTGALPFRLAWASWTVVGLLAIFATAWPLSRRPHVIAAVVASPAVALCLSIGQNGLITAALTVGGLRLVNRRPWLAGLLLGLASFKPQLGILIPVALIAAGRWRVVGAAAASSLTLAAAGWALAGNQGWLIYVTQNLPAQRAVIEHASGIWRALTPSPFTFGQAVGLARDGAYALQALVFAACAVAIFVRFLGRRGAAPITPADIVLLIAAGFLAAPYSLAYDMPGLALALILAMAHADGGAHGRAWRWGVLLLWTAPMLMTLAGLGEIFRGPWLVIGAPLMALALGLAWIGAPLVPASAESAPG